MLCHVVVFFLVFFVRKAAQRTGGKRGIRHKLVLKGSGAKRQKKHPLPSDERRGVFFFFFLLFFSDLISLSLSFPSPAAGRLRGGLRKRFFSIVSIVLCCCRLRLSYFVLSVFLVAKIAGSLFFPGVVFFFPRKERKEKKTVVFLGLKRHGPSCSC